MKITNIRGAILIVALTFTLIIALCLLNKISAEENETPESHHIELKNRPVCTECHTSDSSANLKPIASFIHTGDFINRHRFYASQGSNLCNTCHKLSFCTDCHAYKTELKPSVRYSGAPDRWLPHRGNYLYQHRIDGRLDPPKCFRCHSRQNNQVCRKCHK